MTPASEGLGRYYEHVLQSMHEAEIKEPTDEELDSIDLESYCCSRACIIPSAFANFSTPDII